MKFEVLESLSKPCWIHPKWYSLWCDFLNVRANLYLEAKPICCVRGPNPQLWLDTKLKSIWTPLHQAKRSIWWNEIFIQEKHGLTLDQVQWIRCTKSGRSILGVRPNVRFYFIFKLKFSIFFSFLQVKYIFSQQIKEIERGWKFLYYIPSPHFLTQLKAFTYGRIDPCYDLILVRNRRWLKPKRGWNFVWNFV